MIDLTLATIVGAILGVGTWTINYLLCKALFMSGDDCSRSSRPLGLFLAVLKLPIWAGATYLAIVHYKLPGQGIVLGGALGLLGAGFFNCQWAAKWVTKVVPAAKDLEPS